MKLHFRVLSILLVICLSFPLIATSEEIPEVTFNTMYFSVADVKYGLEYALQNFAAELAAQGTQFYYQIFFNEEKEWIVIEFAIDGVANLVYNGIAESTDGTYKPWTIIKEAILMAYGAIMAILLVSECSNYALQLRLINDNVQFRNDWSIGEWFMYEAGFDGFTRLDNVSK